MKKLLSLVLAVAMLLSLCACGSKEATSNPGATDDESGIAPLNITFNVAVSGEMYDAMTNKFAERCPMVRLRFRLLQLAHWALPERLLRPAS